MRRFLIYTHRWLGITGCLLFIVWFASGIVMMYARMPEIAPEERRERLQRLDLSTARVSIAEAAGGEVERFHINMLIGRPVYRFGLRGAGGYRAVYADNGESPSPVGREQALQIARQFAPQHVATLRYTAFLESPDQWTLTGEARRTLPLHRIELGDSAGTALYVSDQTGEVVMKATARERRWAYAGAIPHWIYFTPLRRHGPLWTQTIIWLSVAGCGLGLSGLIWGVWRISIAPRYRLKREYSRSPYAGLMRWHHYAGLIFGVTTFTWIFSGLLSMDPWDWHPSTAPTYEQRDAVSGGRLRIGDLTVTRLQDAMATFAAPVREVEIFQFRGERFVSASSLLVSLDAPEHGAFAAFDHGLVLASAREAMPAARVHDAVWLDEYDAYYYDRSRTLTLPVLRVRYDDPRETWLYLDPRRGSIIRKEERLSRANRWLYHGLHSIDFPILYGRRPLWDIAVIALSLGGLVVSATTIVAAAHRLRRHWRRVRAIWRFGNLVIW